MAPTIGSHALLLQLTTDLVHNATVHNLPGQGAVWVTAGMRSGSVRLTVENTGGELELQLVATLAAPFQRGTERIRTGHAGMGLGLTIVKSVVHAHDGTLRSPRVPPAGSVSRCGCQPPPRLPNRTMVDASMKAAEAERRNKRPILERPGIRRVAQFEQPRELLGGFALRGCAGRDRDRLMEYKVVDTQRTPSGAGAGRVAGKVRARRLGAAKLRGPPSEWTAGNG